MGGFCQQNKVAKSTKMDFIRQTKINLPGAKQTIAAAPSMNASKKQEK